VQRFFIFAQMENTMLEPRQPSIAGKILDNVLFLAEVFGDRADQDIPKIPVLEMARCFDLAPPRVRAVRRRARDWPLWK
jgi:hypothetical protein